MKRKTGFGIIALLAGVFCFSHMALAAPAGNWVTDFTLFNLGSETADYSMTSYSLCPTGCSQDAGTLFSSGTIAAGGSAYYNPATDSNFPSGFAGSVVVSSGQLLAGTVTLGNGLTGTSYASDAYTAVTVPSNSVTLPIVMAGLGTWYTRMSIQNTGSAAADVQIQYVGSSAPAATTISGLPPNMTAWVDQNDLGALGFNGSAIVTSTNSQPLAIVVEEYKTSGGVLVAYNGLPSNEAGTTLYLPGYIDQGVWATDFTIVNTSASAATATVAFSGNSSTLTGPVAANGSVYLNRYGSLPTGWSGTYPTSFYGAGTITSTGGNVVAVYNISNSGSGGKGNLAVAYTGFTTGKAKQSVVVPLIENDYGTGWVTTFTVQSVDGSPANLSMTYGASSGSPAPLCNPCTANMTTPAQTFNQRTDGHVPSGFIGGVTISSNKNIVVIADQQNDKSSSYSGGDTAAGFGGI